ncbi:hypothetical protein HY251_09380, partial [bacterium]|nr:hypothetical protein [bacterium]
MSEEIACRQVRDDRIGALVELKARRADRAQRDASGPAVKDCRARILEGGSLHEDTAVLFGMPACEVREIRADERLLVDEDLHVASLGLVLLSKRSLHGERGSVKLEFDADVEPARVPTLTTPRKDTAQVEHGAMLAFVAVDLERPCMMQPVAAPLPEFGERGNVVGFELVEDRGFQRGNGDFPASKGFLGFILRRSRNGIVGSQDDGP